MEPTASSLARLPDTRNLTVPDESVMVSLRERLGVKQVQATPTITARSVLSNLTYESIHGSLIREYIEQWLHEGCVPIAFKRRHAEFRIDPSARASTERELIATGYIVSAAESGPDMNKVEPSSKAIAWMWQNGRSRNGLSALAKRAEPSVDGSLVYQEAQTALLAVVHRFQKSKVLGIETIANLLMWSREGTTFWLKKSLEDRLIAPNESRSGVVLTQKAIDRLQSLKQSAAESVPSPKSSRLVVDHQVVKSKIPHVVAGLMRAVPLSLGVAAREIGAALGLSEHFLRGSKILEAMVEQGVLTASRVGVDRHHRELGRFKSSTILYRVTDSAFVPDLTKVSIDAAVSLIAASLTAHAPSGEQYTNPKTGFSVEKVKEVIGALGGAWFSQAQVRTILFERYLSPKQSDHLQRVLQFLVASHFLEFRDANVGGQGRRSFEYRAVTSQSSGQHDHHVRR